MPGEEWNKLNQQGSKKRALLPRHNSTSASPQQPPGAGRAQHRSLLEKAASSRDRKFQASLPPTVLPHRPHRKGPGHAPFQPPSTKANRSAFQASQRASPQAKRVLGLKCFFVNSTGGPMNSSSLPPLCHTLTTPPKRETSF